MIANYHTHTYRCGHAEGDEREYVQKALEGGLKILGFSDHTPYDFYDDKPHGNPMRMLPEELPGYAESIRSLAEEYKDRLEIHLGVEAEYYPKYFPRLLELLRENGVEYMILGQHFLGNEDPGGYSGLPTISRKRLQKYVDQSIEALHTGLFTYFAHPDLIRYTGSRRVYETEMRRLCRAAIETHTPLEINLLGIRDNRHYPNERFWQIAVQEGNEVILGCDAHRPGDVTDPASEAKARETARKLGLKLLETIELRKL